MRFSSNHRVLLVTNYVPDGQQSMLRWGELLARELPARGWEAAIVTPKPRWSWLGRKQSTRKWFAYVDKYVHFPRDLRARLIAESGRVRLLVHIVDHSNSVYVPRLPTSACWVVTCHDLLAVRGALGEDTDCPASPLGRQLQAAIVRGLSRAHAIAADSLSTLRDVERLVPEKRPQIRRRILLGQNYPYHRVTETHAHAQLGAINGVPWHEPFLIHVGSNLKRKNKQGVLRVFAHLAGSWPGNLVFCGAPLAPELLDMANALGIGQRVFAAVGLENDQLQGAYSIAHALVYPSKCEGFGWPVIEAQACGCPVICSDRTSLPEIGGDAALVHPLEDEAGMARSVLELCDPQQRHTVTERGFRNATRFSTNATIDAYIALYEDVLNRSAHP